MKVQFNLPSSDAVLEQINSCQEELRQLKKLLRACRAAEKARKESESRTTIKEPQ